MPSLRHGNLTLANGARKRYMPPMTGPETGGSSEARRKQLLFRAKRRGFKEVDLIFGTFAAAELDRGMERRNID